MKNHLKKILEKSVKIKTEGFAHPLQEIEEIMFKMANLELIWGIKMRPRFPDDKKLDDAVKDWA